MADRSFEGKYEAKLKFPEGWVGGLKKKTSIEPATDQKKLKFNSKPPEVRNSVILLIGLS